MLVNIGILILSFLALEFWPYFCKDCNSDLILPNILILAYFNKYWNYNFILLYIGILALFLCTFEF